MADHYSKPKKSSRHLKEMESVRSKPRSESGQKYHEMESKTPPLPKCTSTLEELMKKRESLKEELKKIVKNTDSEPNKISKKRRHSKDEFTAVKGKRSRDNENKINSNSSKKSIHESSPELENTQMESEDEETIIELRRQKRKLLLEKLNCSNIKSNENDNTINNKTTEDKEIEIIQDQKVLKQVTDMFSEKDEFDSKVTGDKVNQGDSAINLSLTDNWDDPYGYYNIRVGDVINNKYTIKGCLGQGVFANVVRAQDLSNENEYVAIKIVRNNDLMYKTSLKEIEILKQIKTADPNNYHHCVNFLGHCMHKGHLCILLESLHMDLRSVIKKYGKHHGINIRALMCYSRQLLLALRLLKHLGIIHADIKPDNILVNENKTVLKLCDFGSAGKIDENQPTPYLVSRFYRAPEIILGITYNHSIDIWSAACTMYEMATGKIMFTGGSNNKMLKCFMDLKGRFSSRFIKKGKFKDQHFNYNNNFLLHKKDEFTGREKLVEVPHVSPSRDLQKELNKSFRNASPKEEKKVVQLKDLLDKMTTLDSSQRIAVIDCLNHPFIVDLGPNSKKEFCV